MIPVPFPAIDAIALARRSTAAHSDALADLFEIDEPAFQARYQQYEMLLTAKNVIQVPRSLQVGDITKEHMISLYENHMVKKESAGRAEYNLLMASAPRKKCPMCGESTVTALDHHVPKSTYFYHAINPKNLVPICSRCNTAKGQTMPNHVKKQFIHPYFDDFSQITWISVHFDASDPIEIHFQCVPPAHLSRDCKAKLESHFTRLKLDELYTSNAIVRLDDLKETFSVYRKTADWAAVQADLQIMLNGVRRRPASWEFALYSALLNQPWYIQGGFSNI